MPQVRRPPPKTSFEPLNVISMSRGAWREGGVDRVCHTRSATGAARNSKERSHIYRLISPIRTLLILLLRIIATRGSGTIGKDQAPSMGRHWMTDSTAHGISRSRPNQLVRLAETNKHQRVPQISGDCVPGTPNSFDVGSKPKSVSTKRRLGSGPTCKSCQNGNRNELREGLCALNFAGLNGWSLPRLSSNYLNLTAPPLFE